MADFEKPVGRIVSRENNPVRGVGIGNGGRFGGTGGDGEGGAFSGEEGWSGIMEGTESKRFWELEERNRR